MARKACVDGGGVEVEEGGEGGWRWWGREFVTSLELVERRQIVL